MDRRRVDDGRACRAAVAGRRDDQDPRAAHGGDSRLQRVPRAALRRRAAPRIVDHVRRQLGSRVLAGEVGRREEELEALEVAGRHAVAEVHVAAGDPARFGRDTDLVGPVPADDGPHRVGAVVVVVARRRARIAARVDVGQADVGMDRVPPVVVVARRDPVPAAVARAQRRVVPAVAGVLAGDDDAGAAMAERPGLRSPDVGDAPLHGLRRGRRRDRFGKPCPRRRVRFDPDHAVEQREVREQRKVGLDRDRVRDPVAPMRDPASVELGDQRRLRRVGVRLQPFDRGRDPGLETGGLRGGRPRVGGFQQDQGRLGTLPRLRDHGRIERGGQAEAPAVVAPARAAIASARANGRPGRGVVRESVGTMASAPRIRVRTARRGSAPRGCARDRRAGSSSAHRPRGS